MARTTRGNAPGASFEAIPITHWEGLCVECAGIPAAFHPVGFVHRSEEGSVAVASMVAGGSGSEVHQLQPGGSASDEQGPVGHSHTASAEGTAAPRAAARNAVRLRPPAGRRTSTGRKEELRARVSRCRTAGGDAAYAATHMCYLASASGSGDARHWRVAGTQQRPHDGTVCSPSSRLFSSGTTGRGSTSKLTVGALWARYVRRFTACSAFVSGATGVKGAESRGTGVLRRQRPLVRIQSGAPIFQTVRGAPFGPYETGMEKGVWGSVPIFDNLSGKSASRSLIPSLRCSVSIALMPLEWCR